MEFTLLKTINLISKTSSTKKLSMGNNVGGFTRTLEISYQALVSPNHLHVLQSAWNQHFCDNELKALILQDVVRTFPDETYFRDSNVQDLMNPNEVIKYLEKVKEEHLVPLDPELATHLNNCNISMELFGIRWLRLLFGREFPRTEIPHLWSYLFSEGPLLPNIHYVIIAMLISMKKSLLDPDPGTVLSALMRPVGLNVGHVIAFSLHLARPLVYARPSTPPPPLSQTQSRNYLRDWSLEERGVAGQSTSSDEGVAEGADVARELATLALLRAQLPAAAAALAQVLPKSPPHIAQPLQKILQLSALLQCRNHALVDVETALEADEGQAPEKTGKRQLVPVIVSTGSRVAHAAKPGVKSLKKQVKEVPLKLFHQIECDSNVSDLPCLDPLRLRTE
ncbi:TBC1 domain family member 5 [Eumeta japonica]|uniref:TBC1 domain family member 5 n=1 Tax=Eumeta variegata TaxID=151549 RepID=A0A4C1Z472_EUMVA|nr:TBC1 domain family member 5 [Eumeta japonica]